MEGFLFKLAAFLLVVGILVSVHEFGHFWVARKLGVKVLKFSIGFGRPLWKRTAADGVEYVLAAIPLGGYVKMLDEREGEVDASERHLAFNRQSLAVRSAVVVAGPLFNFLFAIVAFWLVLSIGEPGIRPVVGSVIDGAPASQAGFQSGDKILSINETETPTWSAVLYELAAASVKGEAIQFEVMETMGNQAVNRSREIPAGRINDPSENEDTLAAIGLKPAKPRLPVVIGDLSPGEPAELYGLQTGDRLLSADNVALDDWFDWVDYVKQRPGKAIQLELERSGVIHELEIVPAAVATDDKIVGRIGARAMVPEGFGEDYYVIYQLSPLDALPAAIARTWDFSVLTLKVIGRMITGDVSIHNLSGPITIADYAGKSASIGLVSFLKFLAVVSISLGVLNLLPIPVLDGGHLFFYLLEAIKGSPLSETFLEQGQRIGLVLMMSMIALALFVDFSRLLA